MLWPRALRRGRDDGRAVRQGDRLLQGQGRLDAHGRPGQGHGAGHRHRRRRRARSPPACALAFKMRKEKRVAVCFMGDGATNEGAFHEGVNMGAIWDLPVVYVVENNLYGASTPVPLGHQDRDHRRARRGLRHSRPTRRRQRRAGGVRGRRGGRRARPRRRGPDAAGADDLPHHGPFAPRSLPVPARRRSEKQALDNEPIGRFATHLLTGGVADQAALDRIGAEVDAEIEAAVKAALAAPRPDTGRRAGRPVCGVTP